MISLVCELLGGESVEEHKNKTSLMLKVKLLQSTKSSQAKSR